MHLEDPTLQHLCSSGELDLLQCSFHDTHVRNMTNGDGYTGADLEYSGPPSSSARLFILPTCILFLNFLALALPRPQFFPQPSRHFEGPFRIGSRSNTATMDPSFESGLTSSLSSPLLLGKTFTRINKDIHKCPRSCAPSLSMVHLH